MALAKKHNIAVLEDCSHCAGAEWDGKKVGSIGDVGCFSMQGDPIGGKPLAAGEGGMVVTNRQDLYDKILFFGHLNREQVQSAIGDKQLQRLAPTLSGIKFRPHPWAMAAALVLIDGLDERNEKRRQYRARMYEALADVPGITPLRTDPKATPAGFHAGMHFLYEPDELGGLSAAEYIEALQAEGVAATACNPNYITHSLPIFSETGHDLYGEPGPLSGDYPGYPKGSLPVTDDVVGRIIAMPTFIEEPGRYAEQAVLAIKKVSAHYDTLQTTQAKVRRAATGAAMTAARTAKRQITKLLPS